MVERACVTVNGSLGRGLHSRIAMEELSAVFDEDCVVIRDDDGVCFRDIVTWNLAVSANDDIVTVVGHVPAVPVVGIIPFAIVSEGVVTGLLTRYAAIDTAFFIDGIGAVAIVSVGIRILVTARLQVNILVVATGRHTVGGSLRGVVVLVAACRHHDALGDGQRS